MSNKKNMGYQPRPKQAAAPAAAATPGQTIPGYDDEDVFNVPLMAVATQEATIGGRKVTFVKPKFAGLRAFAKHGTVLAANAEKLQDTSDVDAQFEALETSAKALREIVPFMVPNHDQRAHVLAAFDDPAVPLDRLVMCCFGALSKVMNTNTLAEAAEQAGDEAEADHGVSVPESVAEAAAAADFDVDADVVELPTAAAVESGIVDEPLPLPAHEAMPEAAPAAAAEDASAA